MSIKKIIKENLNKKICELIHRRLDKIYKFEEDIYPKFIKQSTDEFGDFLTTYEIKNKDDYWDLFGDMEDYVMELGFEDDEYMDCIEDFIDNKIPSEILEKIFNDKLIDEAEEESSGESDKGGSATGTEWNSGLNRGPANPIDYNTEWKGQRGWEGIKSYNVKRSKANPLT
jgi:hypothetical protein